MKPARWTRPSSRRPNRRPIPTGSTNAKKELKAETLDTWTSVVPTEPAIPADVQSQLDQLAAQQQQQQQQQQQLPTGARP